MSSPAETLAALDWLPMCNITDGCPNPASWAWWSTCGHNGGLACVQCHQRALSQCINAVCRACGRRGTFEDLIQWKAT